MQMIIISSLVLLICIQISPGLCDFEEECLTELGYDKAYIKNGYIERNKIRERDPKLKAFWGCYWKKIGYLTEDGKFNRDRYLITMTRDANQLLGGDGYYQPGALAPYTTDILDTCESITYTDPGDFAVKMKNCIIDEIYQVANIQ